LLDFLVTAAVGCIVGAIDTTYDPCSQHRRRRHPSPVCCATRRRHRYGCHSAQAPTPIWQAAHAQMQWRPRRARVYARKANSCRVSWVRAGNEQRYIRLDTPTFDSDVQRHRVGAVMQLCIQFTARCRQREHKISAASSFIVAIPVATNLMKARLPVDATVRGTSAALQKRSDTRSAPNVTCSRHWRSPILVQLVQPTSSSRPAAWTYSRVATSVFVRRCRDPPLRQGSSTSLTATR
jgi:hypothetical protein